MIGLAWAGMAAAAVQLEVAIVVPRRAGLPPGDATGVVVVRAPVVLVLGAIGSLPELARLPTGRLHRWRVTLDDDGLTDQGCRRGTSEPWLAVRGASVSRGKDAGVVADLKVSRPDLLIPAGAFLAHPQALADEITARAR